MVQLMWLYPALSQCSGKTSMISEVSFNVVVDRQGHYINTRETSAGDS